jgi:hypothetical protein
MLNEGFSAATDLGNERRAKARLFVFVVLRRVVQFALGERVERDAHRSDPALSVAKHLIGGAA